MEVVSLRTWQPEQKGGLLDFETYHGYIANVSDAKKIIFAVSRGQLRQSLTRLAQDDHAKIRSGTVVVWESSLSGIQRWTDKFAWSGSRLNDHFLVYEELVPSLTPKPKLKPKLKLKLKLKPRPKLFGGGLEKKTLTIKDFEGNDYHLVNYYLPAEAGSTLIRPSNDPLLLPNAGRVKKSAASLSLPPVLNIVYPPSPEYHSEDLRQLNLLNLKFSP